MDCLICYLKNLPNFVKPGLSHWCDGLFRHMSVLGREFLRCKASVSLMFGFIIYFIFGFFAAFIDRTEIGQEMRELGLSEFTAFKWFN